MKSPLAKVAIISGSILSFVLLVFAGLFLFQIFRPLANLYLNSQSPVGSDYYNGLTYLHYISKDLPFPSTGWLSFWHEGIPIIGGYPTFSFYLASQLTRWMDVSSSLDLFSVATQFAFPTICLFLFWVITRSAPISFFLAFIILKTKATYYQSFVEGLIAGGAAQWLTPLAILFVYIFIRTKSKRWLVLSGVFAGLGLLFHPAIAFLTVVVPSIVILIIYSLVSRQRLKAFIKTLGIFAVISSLVGSTAIYSTYLQIIKGAGSGACDSPQCWGIYPEHINTWLNYIPLSLGFAASLFLITIVIKLISPKGFSTAILISFIIAFIVLLLYPIASYFQLINEFASAVFPRRLFWAINLYLLLIAGVSFREIRDFLGHKHSPVLTILSVALIIMFYLSNPAGFFDISYLYSTNRPATIPYGVETYMLPKYKTQDISELVPAWVKDAAKDGNFRMDSLNNQVNHWWNIAFDMPATRGYSNAPTGNNADWLYYLQVGTSENKEGLDPEIIKNRTLFLIDHYAISLYEDSGRSMGGASVGYDETLLSDKEIFPRNEGGREVTFYEISPEFTSGIVSPTNGKAVLIISDETGYETFVRALSLTGLTSREIITVAGPKSLNSISEKDLSFFDAVIFYRYKPASWSKLKGFLEKGGKVFVELATEEKASSPPSFFPISSYTILKTKGKLALLPQKSSTLLKNVDLDRFSEFSFEKGPWRTAVSPKESLSKEAETIIIYKDGVLLSKLKVGSGEIIVSGINLPFHIVTTENKEEVELFSNILLSLGGRPEPLNPEYEVTRYTPGEIVVTGKNFKGIYFKENFDSGWNSSVGSRKLTISKGGMDFMYIPNPEGSQNNNVEIWIKYKGNITVWFLFYLTIISLFLSLSFVVIPQPFTWLLSKAKTYFRIFLGKRISDWIKEE